MPRAERPMTPQKDLDARRNWAGPVVAGVLTPELVAFCQSGVSVVLGTLGGDGRPIAGIALACAIDEIGMVRIFLREPSNRDLLQAIERGGAIAVTFTEPRTHRSIQIKGERAKRTEHSARDLVTVARQIAVFRRELEFVDYPPKFAAYYCTYREEEVTAFEFVPHEAFVQTPGPGAGSVLCP